ncbi:hypothetical protein VLK31_28320 [Variovorax sp. H27-G14]|uniref:hypothetical protein n=1 Tax=Variovorax sp. H27-G14 TaxID=3111914 RepID=UPI0038FCDF61
MTEPRGLRHPLFLRLLKPVDPVYPDAVTPVAWDDDECYENVEGVAYVVTRQCARMRAWAQQLRKLHNADETYKTEEGISPLSGAPLRNANLRALGMSLDLYSDKGHELRSGRFAARAYLTTDLLAVIARRAGGDAVGFVSFRLKWIADAFEGVYEGTELEVELDQAWMAPAFRRRGWGELAVTAIACATRQHVDQVETTTHWPAGFVAPLKITVAADLYSTSGEALLAKCADCVALAFGISSELQRLQVSEIVLDGRW